MTGSKDIHGTVVSESEVSAGLGFKSIEDFRFFQEHIDKANEIVTEKLVRWFGPDKGDSQINFAIAAKLTEYFCGVLNEKRNERTPKSTT